jgi:cell division protein FtsL
MKSLSILNAFLVAGLVVFAFILYGHEHKTRMAERQIRKIEAQIRREEESMRILRIEWAMLINPDRLERLANKHLAIHVVPPQRIRPASVALAGIPVRKARPLARRGADSLTSLIARVQRGEAGQ